MKHCKKNKDPSIDNHYQMIKDNSYYIIEETENQIGGSNKILICWKRELSVIFLLNKMNFFNNEEYRNS